MQDKLYSRKYEELINKYTREISSYGSCKYKKTLIFSWLIDTTMDIHLFICVYLTQRVAPVYSCASEICVGAVANKTHGHLTIN